MPIDRQETDNVSQTTNTAAQFLFLFCAISLLVTVQRRAAARVSQ